MTLVRMSVDDVLARWRPGSHDTADAPSGANLTWTWAHEFYDMLNNPEQRDRTAAVRLRVIEEGIGFVDGVTPIQLGNDGRVWDGHHRLCVARELGIEHVLVDIVRTERLDEDQLIGYAHAPRVLETLRNHQETP